MEKIGLEAILKMTSFNKGMREYTSDVSVMEKATDKASSGLKVLGTTFGAIGLAAGGVTGAIYTLSKAFEFGKEGAAIAQTEESFNRLMDSMGVAPDILQQMRDATLGTVDDMTLMSSTMTLLAGTSENLGKAMVGAAPRLLEIAKAANKLNPALGDTAHLYDSLATGIKRSSPLILDNLGLTIKIGEANEQYAKSIGKTVEEMTAEDKQMALLEATLRAGDRMIEQVDGSTEAMGDSFAQAEVQIKNATNELKKQFAPAIADVTAAAAKATPEIADTANAIVTLAEAGMEWVVAALTGEDATKAFDNSILQNVTGLTEHERAVQGSTLGVDALTMAMRDASVITEQMESDTVALAMSTDDYKASLDLLHAAIKGEVGKALDKLRDTLSSLRAELDAGKISQSEFTAKMRDATDAFQENTNAVIYNVAEKQILDALEKGLIKDVNASGTAYDEATDALWALAEQLGLVDANTIAVMEATQAQTSAFIEGQISADLLAGRMDHLAGTVAGAAAEGRDLQSVIEGLHDKEITVTTHYRTTGEEPGGGRPGAHQHGGSVQAAVPILVGEGGPEVFVPDQPGTIMPNWSLNLPAITGAGATGGSAVGPTVNITMNPTINNAMDLAEFEMITERTVQRAIRGI